MRVREGAGHFPHHDDPLGFAELTGFIDATRPPRPDELLFEHDRG